MYKEKFDIPLVKNNFVWARKLFLSFVWVPFSDSCIFIIISIILMKDKSQRSSFAKGFSSFQYRYRNIQRYISYRKITGVLIVESNILKHMVEIRGSYRFLSGIKGSGLWSNRMGL